MDNLSRIAHQRFLRERLHAAQEIDLLVHKAIQLDTKDAQAEADAAAEIFLETYGKNWWEFKKNQGRVL